MVLSLLPRETGDDPAKRDDVLTSLVSCLSYSFLEEARGKMRKKWLHELREIGASPLCTTDPLPCLKRAFEIITEDGRLYGTDGSVLSANVAEASGNGTEIVNLRFIAASSNDAQAVVGQNISWTDADTVSMSAVTEGLPIHVRSIHQHGHVKLFKRATVSEVGSYL